MISVSHNFTKDMHVFYNNYTITRAREVSEIWNDKIELGREIYMYTQIKAKID